MPEDKMDIGWRILFGESAPKIFDPNVAANIPRKKAEDQRRHEGIQRFITGEGAELAGQWRVGIKSGLLSLLQSADATCHCPACLKLARIRILFNLFLETSEFLKEK